MILAKAYTTAKGGDEIKNQVQGSENKNLLELTPNDFVFYVGGYPADFTVSSMQKSQLQFCWTHKGFVKSFLFFFLSHHRLSSSPSTMVASSSSLLTIKSSVSITSKRWRTSRHLHARGRAVSFENLRLFFCVFTVRVQSETHTIWTELIFKMSFSPVCPDTYLQWTLSTMKALDIAKWL